ncbi:MAG: protein kinase, partial [Ktedonobacteraceae bacterium]|nr:protein kinase [Ktedonobacteraceae bacterium]
MMSSSQQELGGYRVLRGLGSGGAADVYLCQQTGTNRCFAMKVFRNIAGNESERRQLTKEAGTILSLDHPGIVRLWVCDILYDPPFLIMDYAPNGTLQERHPRGTQLPLEAVIPYINQIVESLEYAHQRHVIHRDLKPSNLLLGKDNEILLSDFGIAIYAHRTLSRTQQLPCGTPGYAAPEQWSGDACLASDQYALAVIVYEWLAGDLPHQGNPIWQFANLPPPSLPAQVKNRYPNVEAVLQKALCKDPRRRYRTIRNFASALAKAASVPPRRPISKRATLVWSIVAVLLLLLSTIFGVWQNAVPKLSLAESSSPDLIGSFPSGITNGPDNNLWFVERMGHVGSIMTSGRNPKEFVDPLDNSRRILEEITLGPDGNLWFTEYERDRIGRISPTTGAITEFSSGITVGSFPSGITVGPDGNLWFTEYGGNRIGRISPTTGAITEFSSGITVGSFPSGIAAGPDGNLWFTEDGGNRIGRITPNGAVTEFSSGITVGSSPSGIAAGPDGNLWFTESLGNRIGEITPKGKVIGEFPLSRLGAFPT